MSNMNQDITSFKGTFLSNMTPCTVVYQGITYSSVENFYQAMKTTDHALRLQISKMNPYESKRFAKTMEVRPDWDEVKDKVMVYGLKQKFVAGSQLAKQLLATGNVQLIEGNYWGDTYWGVCNGKGQNKLGKMLMDVRASLVNVPKVYSKRNPADIPKGAVYVGRPTKWGNPFEMGKHGNRDEVVAKYKAWVVDQPELMAALDELKGKDLVCWCAPEACHADVLLKLANG